ncbi:hypothetical protein DERF_014458 [Dermatophagoides farinae]|uniref:Uncharacterized protein n=1 Tax=Dermatophagoides farinae TaxID=6954 RepID=A0A922L1A9_DERFA|nr:hypothetical protein DERF_014458 [Dermatophagoides farinae]
MANRIFFVFIFAVFGTIVQSKRILFYEQNPGCNIVECNDTHVVHITSEVDDDKNQSTYHNLWIFTNDYKPTIILFETEPKAKLSIDWLKFFQHENNSIIFKNGSVLNINFTEPRDNQSSILAIFSNENSSIGNFRFHLKSSAHSGREQLLPKLIYSNAGNLLQFEINDLFIPESIKQNNTRLQLCANLTTILGGHRLNSQIEKFTGMDDEYTPGVFQRYLYQMETIDKVDNNNQTRSSFIGWKPVAYFDHKQQIATSLKVISPSIENMTTIPLSSSALNGYFQSPTSSYTINKLANFRFNSEDDNEFDLTINGTSIEFSLSLSLIALSETQFSTSMTIIIVCILIGFGLPFILLIGFIMFTMSKRLLSLFVGSGSNNYNLQHNSESSG